MQAGMASVLRGALLTGLYFAGAVMAVFYLRTPADVTLFWPAAGIGFAAVLRYGAWQALTIPVAMLLLHVFVVPVPPLFMAYSIASNTLATMAAAWYVRRSRDRERRLHLRTSDGFLLLRGGMLLSALSATIGTIGMLQAGMAPAADAGRVALQWAMGDLLGVTCLGPLLLYLFWMVHILPEKIAERRGHPQADAIKTLCLLSLVFGGLLWPVAWLWAYSKPVFHKMAYGTDRIPHETPSADTAAAPETASAADAGSVGAQPAAVETPLVKRLAAALRD